MLQWMIKIVKRTFGEMVLHIRVEQLNHVPTVEDLQS